MIPAISSRTFNGSSCVPDVLLFLLFAGFFAVFLLVPDLLPFPFFFIIAPHPTSKVFLLSLQKPVGAPFGARPLQEVLPFPTL